MMSTIGHTNEPLMKSNKLPTAIEAKLVTATVVNTPLGIKSPLLWSPNKYSWNNPIAGAKTYTGHI